MLAILTSFVAPHAARAASPPFNVFCEGDRPMKRIHTVVAVALLLLLPLTMAFAAGGGDKHPRIHHAIMALHAAITELKAAPHDFGGHRADAVAACEKAVEQLKLALAYDKGADQAGH
jgi:hypothetical protein